MDNDRTEYKLDTLIAAVEKLSDNITSYMFGNKPHTKMSETAGKYSKDTEFEDAAAIKQDFSKDENEERGNWTGQADFLLSCLGYAVGLGNVWRFPYLCYKNGGAVFFIPYVIMLLFVGVPIFFMELSLGQFTSNSPLTCWDMAIMFKGVGVAMVAVSAMVAIYYNVIIAWSLFYFFASFTSDLPWQYCNTDYSTPYCAGWLNQSISQADCVFPLYDNDTIGVCFTNDSMIKPYGIYNQTLAKEQKPPIRVILPSEDYLNGYVLGKTFSKGIDDLGPVRWQMAFCLFGAWVIVYLSLIKGVKSSGKVVYFTAIFPYVVLVILLIRGVILDGAREGIEFYIMKPDLSRLSDATVWKDAAVQIFFSLSASWGGLITLSSYNRFHNNCLRDALIVSISNCLTSFFAGFVIFSFLGYLAKEMGVSVDDVAESGIGLAFIVYPAAIIRMPYVPTFWALLFFMMLITLGLDSEFALVETVTTSMMDQWKGLRKYKPYVILAVCVVMYCLGLTMCTNGGAYMLQLMDTYAGGWNVLLIAIFECLVIVYVYGYQRFNNDILIMIGSNPLPLISWKLIQKWWVLCWGFLTPAIVTCIMIFSWVKYEKITYGNYEYPAWAEALGWLMTMFVVVCLIVPIFYKIVVNKNAEGVKYLMKPHRRWGPALPKHRRLMASYLGPDEFVVDPDSDDIQFTNAGPTMSSQGADNTGYAMDSRI